MTACGISGKAPDRRGLHGGSAVSRSKVSQASATPNTSPYDTSPGNYTAGGTIEMVGNMAVYRSGETVFRAVYTEGKWKVAAKQQQGS